MRNPFLLLLVGAYLVAFSINLMPAIKHPDLSVGILNLVATIIFLVALFVYSRIGNNKMKVFLVLGAISGIIVFVIKTFEHLMFGNVLLDMIASIQYPIYFIFTTPLFGANILFDLNYGAFSLLMSLVYIVIFAFMFFFKKHAIPNV